jgi:predicted CXXCH cytochrome family protein
VVLAGVGLATWATPASANAGPHGGYTLTTSACAGCHRAHTAESPNLVKADSIYGLCTSCHGGLVSTDVVHGVLQGATNTDGTTPRKLNGGGFEQQNGANVTSRHKVEDVPINGTPWTGTDTAFGSQNGDGTPTGDIGAGVQGVLECTSCHNPHGSTNYRILNDSSGASNRWVASDPDILDFVQYQVLATRDDAPNYGFDFTNVADCPVLPTRPAGSPTPYGGGVGPGSKCIQRFTSGVLVATPAAAQNASGQYLGMNAFCATCHKSYYTLSGSAHRFNSLNTPVPGTESGPGTPTRVPAYIYPGVQYSTEDGQSIARYRHAVNRNYTGTPKQPLRYAAIGIDPNPSGSLSYQAFGCLMCHYAHGTGAAATPAAGTTPEGPAGDSALLFYGNRGVCVSCHQSVEPIATLTPTATP